MSEVPVQVRVPKAAELVASQLRRRIVRGDLEAGDVLPPEAVLLRQFGVSRPTLREAFRVLEAEALIEVRRGSRGGAQVKPPDGDVAARYAGLVLEHRKASLADVFEATALIEGQSVRQLARRRTAADLRTLREAREREDSAPDAAASLRAQNEFHRLVVELHGNLTMGVVAGMLRHLVDTATQRMLEREGVSERQIEARHKGDRTHRKLVDLIDARDADGAEELWVRHVRGASRYLEQTLGTQTVLDLLG